MISDGSTPASGNAHAPEAIDAEQLLACIPDESSDGLRREDILQSYRSGRSAPFGEHDLDVALAKLASEGRVRTTTKRRGGIQVRFYMRTSR